MRMTRGERAEARAYIEQRFLDGKIDEQELNEQLATLEPPRKSRKGLAVGIAAGMAGLLIGGAFGIEVGYQAAEDRAEPSARVAAPAPVAVSSASLTRIASTCGLYGHDSDNGHTLTLNAPKGVSFERVACVYEETEMPQSVRDHIGSTRALDGQQTATWGDYAARWTYHPDAGLDITFTV